MQLYTHMIDKNYNSHYVLQGVRHDSESHWWLQESTRNLYGMLESQESKSRIIIPNFSKILQNIIYKSQGVKRPYAV